MATTPQKNNPVPQQTAAPKYTSPLAAKTRTSGPIVPKGNQTFLFDKDNYMWMIIGVVCLLIGFFLMAGGKSPDPHQFNAAEVFSARRITIAPLVILLGFGIEAYAIMKKPKAFKNDSIVVTEA